MRNKNVQALSCRAGSDAVNTDAMLAMETRSDSNPPPLPFLLPGCNKVETFPGLIPSFRSCLISSPWLYITTFAGMFSYCLIGFRSKPTLVDSLRGQSIQATCIPRGLVWLEQRIHVVMLQLAACSEWAPPFSFPPLSLGYTHVIMSLVQTRSHLIGLWSFTHTAYAYPHIIACPCHKSPLTLLIGCAAPGTSNTQPYNPTHAHGCAAVNGATGNALQACAKSVSSMQTYVHS